MKPLIHLATFAIFALAIEAPTAQAAKPADQVLPADTVGFFSIADIDDFLARWDRTQIGLFTADSTMKPFIAQMKDNLINKFGNIKQRLGVTLDDVTAAASGEIAVGMLHREGRRASIAVVMDATGKEAEAKAFVQKLETELARRKGKRSAETYGGRELVVFLLPAGEQRRAARQVVHFTHNEQLVVVDSVAYAKLMVDSLVGGDAAVLAGVNPYVETMQRCRAAEQNAPANLRWFAAPVGFDIARRTLHDERQLADRKDTMTILREQGFDAILGVGGHVAVAVDPQRDFIHRTAIYAPGKPGATTAAEKYKLAMRMVELPNRRDMPVQDWAPRMTANYHTLNANLLNAFDYASSLFDAMSGYEGAFQTTLDSFEVDPYGPQIKVRKQLIQNLGTRITMMTDYKLPITPDCERYLFVVQVKNPDLFRSPLDKLMENDGAIRRQEEGISYWEIVPEDAAMASSDVESGDDLFGLDDPVEEPELEQTTEQRDRVLRRAAVCLHEQQLIVASDVEFLRQALFGIDDRDALEESPDFLYAMKQLDSIASAERCSWSFTRTDESFRPTYELIRRGLMPQSQTFFGRLLNEALTTAEDEERGIVREQRIDGSKLPPFEMARRYFGPSVRAVHTDEEGWFVTGVVLSKAGK